MGDYKDDVKGIDTENPNCVNRNKALVFGAAVIDVGFELSEDHTPRPDASTQAEDITVTPGGKGLAQAVALSRMGFEVSLATVIGNKIFKSEMITSLLDAEGIDKTFVKTEGNEMTPITGVITLSTGKSFAIGDKKEDELSFSTGDIDKYFNENEVEKFGFVLITYELPILIIEKILTKLDDEKYGETIVIVTPAPPVPYNKRFDAYYRVNYLVAKEWEAKKMLGGSADTSDPQDLLSGLNNIGIECACLTTDYNVYIKEASKNVVEAKRLATTRKGTNWERDVFCAALAYILKTDKSFSKDSMDFMVAAMGWSNQQKKGFEALPTVEEVNSFIKRRFKN